ncbi:NAD(P)-binding protein [Hypoxylon fragiforme]|uniref:NAD(P)-binding protein n=1 Tax=Hypoxylon fragiforme TaxID=63214 RepID=UPI0020C632E5|nr:NAD(P)-binding protein [Hypoxylon fragiforme]KAI2605447.1 NAD(P)-binding protein [Hypoxylon fragiforme]
MASDKKIVLVTGGNTGLGYETVKALYQTDTPYELIIGCRTISKGETAIATLRTEVPQSPSSLSTLHVDLESDASLENAVESIASRFAGRLDVLVNNGGGTFDQHVPAGNLSLREAWNKSWETNVTGTHVLTTLAVPLLLKSADPRLLFITSGTSALKGTEDNVTPAMQRLNFNPEPGWPKKELGLSSYPAYRAAKTGLNMVMREWNRLLMRDGVKVWAVSPGFLATGLTGVGRGEMLLKGARDPATGGQFVKDVIQGKRDEDVGLVVGPGRVQPW